MKIAVVAMLLLTLGVSAFGQVQAPEIDGASASTAVAMIAGAVMIFRARRK